MTNATAILEVIAEPTRRAIVERLVEHPASVTEIARDLPVTRSAVSQHLQLLRAVGLVTVRPVGTRRVYRVDPDSLALVREYFDVFWTRSLAAFQEAAESTGDES